MQFRDRTLLRLLDHVERAALLTTAVGDGLLAAAFAPKGAEVDGGPDPGTGAAVGPVTAVTARQVTLLPVAVARQRVDAQVHDVQTNHHWQVSAAIPQPIPHATVPWSVPPQAAGEGPPGAPATPPVPAPFAHPSVPADADARLDLLLAASCPDVTSTLTDVETEDLSGLSDEAAIDARIVREDGALPPEGPQRQARRLAALRAALTEHFEAGEAVPLEAALERRGLTTYESLSAYLSPPHAARRLKLTVLEDSSGPPLETAFSLVCLVYAHPRPFDDLAGLLATMQLARARVADSVDPPQPPRPPEGMTVRATLPALLLFPEAALDDPGLPMPPGGAGPPPTREARLAELTTRLRQVAVVPVPLSPLPGENP